MTRIERYGIKVGQVYDRADGADAPVVVTDTTSHADVDDVVIEYVNGTPNPHRIDAFKLARVRYFLRKV